MDLQSIIDFFSSQSLSGLFFKAFAVVFALLYIVFAIAVQRQIIIMNRTFETKAAFIVLTISTIQIFFAVLTLILAIILI